ncbi:MAG: hypothetical protein EOP51_04600 [Sphingobacteriales bacterium]|nr:MAG: hypothetical protein EOP51_04600 [Sphingobacteriales bacterium]
MKRYILTAICYFIFCGIVTAQNPPERIILHTYGTKIYGLVDVSFYRVLDTCVSEIHSFKVHYMPRNHKHLGGISRIKYHPGYMNGRHIFDKNGNIIHDYRKVPYDAPLTVGYESYLGLYPLFHPDFQSLSNEEKLTLLIGLSEQYPPKANKKIRRRQEAS